MKVIKAALLILLVLVVLPPKVGHAASIRLDGDFTDWVDKPLYDSQDNDKDKVDGFKQLKWHLSKEDDKLYIMAAIKKPNKNSKGKITTVIETDFGTFQAVTDYDMKEVSSVTSSVYGKPPNAGSASRVSVMTSVNTKGQSWKDGGDWGSMMPDGSVYIEYGVPVRQMTEGMKWGYLIKFRLLNASGDAPKNSWITVSTASTFPFVGVGICVTAGILIPTFIKRKKRE